jgi:hypothetical protein
VYAHVCVGMHLRAKRWAAWMYQPVSYHLNSRSLSWPVHTLHGDCLFAAAWKSSKSCGLHRRMSSLTGCCADQWCALVFDTVALGLVVSIQPEGAMSDAACVCMVVQVCLHASTYMCLCIYVNMLDSISLQGDAIDSASHSLGVCTYC